MKFRFSISSSLFLITLSCVVLAWAVDHRKLRSEIDKMLAANVLPWHRLEIQHEMPFLDFDPESKKLFGKLVAQPFAWQCGLIHYLGIDDYRGAADPSRHRTVWWHQAVTGEEGQELFIFFADHEHREHVPDCSAYIVTDESYRLIHWEGTQIDRSLTSTFQCTGNSLPLILTYGAGSHINSDSGSFQIRVRSNGVDGPRGMSHTVSAGWHFPDTWP